MRWPRPGIFSILFYENARIVRVEADAAVVFHSGGVARIPLEAFDASWREALGYDPEAAAAARRAETERRNAAVFASFTGTRWDGPAAAPAHALEPRCAVFKVVQVLDEGLLVSPHSRGGTPGRTQKAVASLFGRSAPASIPPRTDCRIYYLRGEMPGWVADGDVIEVRYLATDEVYRYESVLGGIYTVRTHELVTMMALD